MPFPQKYGINEDVNLYGFRKLLDDISRPYLFMVEMPNIETDAIKLTAFAASTSIPSHKLSSGEIQFQGHKIKVVTGATFSNWQVEFIMDRAYSLRSKFLAWMAQAYDPHRTAIGSPHSYKFDGVKVHQLSRTGDKVQTYQFVGLYPESISDIKLGHGEEGYSKFSVDFAYDYFSIEGGNLLEMMVGSGTNTGLGILTGFGKNQNINNTQGNLYLPKI